MAMKPLRSTLGIAIDGGGIKGLIIARAPMEDLGDKLGRHISTNEFASAEFPEFDPEGLFSQRDKLRAARGHSVRP